MASKTCVVTGASRGIGFYTAHALALMGADVILVGHNAQRGQQAVKRIQDVMEQGQPDGEGSVGFSLVDLSVQAEIRAFVDRFKGQHERLDVLVNNAGGFFMERRESADGIEMTFALNHLNYFLTTHLLLDLLRETADRNRKGSSRIVNVSSGVHRGGRIHLNDLELKKGYNGQRAYAQSKLANVLFTYELHRRLAGDSVTVNALHPGFVDTRLGKDHWLVGPLLNMLHALFAKHPERGAETSIYLASSSEVERVSGKYFENKQPVRSSRASYNAETARALWDISAEMTGLRHAVARA